MIALVRVVYFDKDSPDRGVGIEKYTRTIYGLVKS